MRVIIDDENGMSHVRASLCRELRDSAGFVSEISLQTPCPKTRDAGHGEAERRDKWARGSKFEIGRGRDRHVFISLT
jgi:hypothetical protein